ncbi:hypothetical protein ACOK4R_06450 [Pseudomonas fluorescens]
MDIGAIGKMLGMARGQESLEQGGAQGEQCADKGAEKGGKDKPDPMKMLMDMLSKAAGGAQGGGGGGGSEGSGGEGQMGQDMLEKLMGGRQGMEAMMPAEDTGRKIEA